MTRSALVAIGVATLGVRGAPAQTITGTVVAKGASTPIAGARIIATHSRLAAFTNHAGRFDITLTVLPDTLTIAAIGWVPDTVVVSDTTGGSLVIALRSAPIIISDLIVSGARVPTLDLTNHGRWRMPIEAARAVPPAVETDVYRALALIPAVSFTSPLSARPMVRGYDAQEVTTRIDGFEALNLFHLGRAFASFPADATDEIVVSTAPYAAAQAGSIAGILDVAGRTGPIDRFQAGLGLSFGSLSGYAGGGNRQARYFFAGRFLHLKALGLIPGIDVPYHFEDIYGSVAIGPPERPRGRITAFATQDRAGANSTSFLNWGNVLLGGRWLATKPGRTEVELSVSGASFREDGDDVPSVHAVPADLSNRFTRVTVTADLATAWPLTRVDAGLSLGWRDIVNRIADADPDRASVPRFPTTSLRLARPELGAHAMVTRRAGRLTLAGGIRLDAAGTTTSLAPRLSGRLGIGRDMRVSAGLGRTSRLYHLVGDARSEPDFDFLDFWLSAGPGIPTAVADHATLELNLERGSTVARLGGYASHGSAIGELEPEHDQGTARFFRFGESRTRGLEAQLAYRGTRQHPASFSLTYVYGKSERNWGEGWVRWAQDRRHQGRAFGQLARGRLTVFGAMDAATGMPLTPVVYAFGRGIPGADPRGSTVSLADSVPVYGPENGATTSGTLRVDAGATYRLVGRPGSAKRFHLVIGISIINVLAGPVAPFGLGEGAGRYATDRKGRWLPYRRLFNLPTVPTLTLRAEL